MIINHDPKIKFTFNVKKKITPQVQQLFTKLRDYCTTPSRIAYTESISSLDRDIIEIIYHHVVGDNNGLQQYEDFLENCSDQFVDSERDLRYLLCEKAYNRYEGGDVDSLVKWIRQVLAIYILEYGSRDK